MKVNRLEAHDRLEHLKKDQSLNIFLGAEECLKNNPDSLALQEHSPYMYIFAHPRTTDDGLNKRMLWQPRLTKPEAQTNSYLFRAISNTDILEVCWLIPPKELWSQYQRGNVVHEPLILWSINQFRFNKKELEAPSREDFHENQIKAIYKSILSSKREKDAIKRLADATSENYTCQETNIHTC